MGKNKLSKNLRRKAAEFKGTKCLNCGHPLELTDKYCSNCSQLNSTKQLSLNDFFQEFVSSIFTYDSRLRYTIKDLLFKPGTITRNYVNGQRLKYANPFRFFLSVSIIYFILQGFSSNFNTSNNNFSAKIDGNPSTITNTDSLKTKIDSILKKNNLETRYLSDVDLDTIQWSTRTIKRFYIYREFYNNTKIKNPKIALDSLKHQKTSLNKWIYNKNNAIDRALENPFGFAQYLMTKIPFFLFFFAPFFAFFFWIFYSTKNYNYMEHLIFIFHIFSFVFLLLLICFIPDLILNDGIFAGITITFIGPFYFYKALRNFYKQRRLMTLFKFVLLNITFFIGSTIAALLFFSISAAIY